MKSIILLTNIMTPYRKYFYDELYREFKSKGIQFHVLVMARTEPNRNWNYEDYKTEYSILLEGKTMTIGGSIFIHINCGLKSIYKEMKPDVIICAGSYLQPALWETQRLARKFRYKTYFWSESHLGEIRSYNGIKIKIRESIRKIAFGKFDGFWYAGKFSKEFIECYARKGADYIFVPNLINEDIFDSVNSYSEEKKKEIKKKYDIQDGKRVLLTPARLSPEKGILEFMRLYKDVDNNNDAVYLIAGDGELKATIKDYCRQNGLDVRLLGYKNEEELLELYAIANIFILPSLSDSNPLTCIEACWCSLPILVSNHVGNYPELVNEGVNGYVIEYNNLEESKNKINKILSTDYKWEEQARRYSHHIASKQYRSSEVVERIVGQILEL